MLQWTGERFLPGVEGDIVVEHLHRYHAAGELVDGLQVLDVACGEGYGSTILARRAASVIGVDISVDAVAYAKAKYPRENLRFVVGSCAQIPLPDASVDAIVSFETIAHIGDQQQTLREFARVLRPGGWLCISSPDKLEYSDLPGNKNEYHVLELYADEFRDLLQRSFANVVMYGQRVQHGSMLGPVERTESRFFSYRSEGDAAVRGLGLLRPLYLIAMASNGACPELPSGSFEPAGPAFLAQMRELEQPLAEARQALVGQAGAPAGMASSTLLETTEATLYVKRTGEESFSEERAQHLPIALNDTEVRLEFELHASADAPLMQVRLDLAERICQLDIFELALVADGIRLWSWSPGEAHALPWRETSGMVARPEAASGVLRVLCTNTDPQCTLDIAAEALTAARAGGWLMVRLKGGLVADTAVIGLGPLAAIETGIAHAGQQMALVEELSKEIARVRAEAAHVGGERDLAHAQYKEATADRDHLVGEVQRTQAEKLEVLQLLGDATRERDIAALRVAQLSDQLSALTARVVAGEEASQNIVRSRTGRAGMSLRRIPVNARVDARHLRSGLARAARRAWQMLPVDLAWKRALKDWVFNSAGPLLRSTDAYERWLEHRRSMQRIEQRIAETNGVLVVPDDTPTAAEHSAALPRPGRLPALPEPKAVPLTTAPPLHSMPVRLIAFYLPQFHPIAENDAWWGRGFTEWTNVTRAVPQFVGHYQPHLPGELGFYDLRLPEVQRRQVELARLYGIGAFCFYLYWFAGKKLLERPLLQYLKDPSLNLPFCVCWANENWTRRWDGMDAEVLVAQRHSPEDDLAFIEYVAQFLRDRRYVRIDGKPLLLVYRPSLLPSARETAQRWREWCRRHGVGEIYLAYTQSFEAFDPAEYGFDAAIEFPPNLHAPPVITDRIKRLNPEFSGTVFDWTVFVERSRHYAARTPPYTLFRAVTPSWDNEARRPGRGGVFWGSNPDGYRTWLQNAIVDTVSRFSNRDERLVFVNAWNEWAEGAHLEPDRRYGYAWLQATRDALVTANAGERRRVLIVSHDAHPHGAQFLALHLAQGFAEDLRCYVDIVLLGEGELAAEFAHHGVVHSLAGEDSEGARAVALANRLRAAGTRAAICNTTVSGRFMATLKRAGIRCVTLVHEMPGIVASHRLEHEARCIVDQSDVVVFPGKIVADGFRRFGALADSRTRLRPQGLYKRNRYASASGRDEARAALRMRLGLPAETRVVLAVGYADHRKGIDLFVEVGTALMRSDPNVVFVWHGHHDLHLWPSVCESVEASGFADRFVFPGRVTDTDLFFAGADVLALPSREDPFPSVVLEALQVGVPVVAFEGSSGCCELIAQGCGLLAPAFDVGAFAHALRRLLDNPALAAEMGGEGANRVARDFSFLRYLFDLAQWLELPLKRVSVVVPNYNYGALIAERLASIEQQTYPVYELIVLDDASTDGSVEAIRQQLATLAIDTRLVVNERNSGSVFRQWRHGAELASGDIVWIAEADDLADPEFLEATVAAFVDSEVVVSYCQSRQMGPDGAILCEHYRDYTADVSTDKWLEPYVADGTEEIRTALAIKNTIPNVSAVLFRRDALLSALDSCGARLAELRIAGDWLVYVTMLATGRIAFTPRALNSHRRHPGSVTVSNFSLLQLREIVTMQQSIRRQFALDDAVRRVATAYAQRLFEQFGLQRDGQSRVEEHPLLAPALGE